MRLIATLAALSLALSFAAPAAAQQMLRPGVSLNGALTPGDARLNSGEYMDVYELDGQRGDRISILMSSTDLDSYLMIDGPGGFSDQNDDARAGSLDAHLDVRLPVSGRYRVVATSYAPGETGRYRISVEGGGSWDAYDGHDRSDYGRDRYDDRNGGGELRPGQSVSGVLSRGDAQLNSGEYHDDWTLRGRRGERFTLRMASSDFDAYLMARGLGLSEDNDDDPTRRGSRDSRLELVFPADGEITVSATSYAPGETGRYTLSVERSDSRGYGNGYGQAPSEVAEALRLGQPRQGRLQLGDSQLRSGEYIDSYSYAGRAGERIEITLNSSQFDPYVAISGPNGFSEFNDDDPSGGLNSRLVTTLPADGLYIISATSYAPGETGAYQLGVRAAGYDSHDTSPYSRGGEWNTSPGGRLSVGETVNGRLAPGDRQLDSGEYADSYSFIGRRGQRITIDAISDDFDSYLILRGPGGQQVDNDDGPNGLNAQISEVLQEDGEYTVQVTSYAAGETGRYSVSLSQGQESERQRHVQAGQRVFAVMVGVADYQGNHNDLPYTDEDAIKLEEELRRNGVLNPASVVLTNAQATRRSVMNAFDRVASQAGPEDVFLFFFSGHGVQHPSDAAHELDGQSEHLVLYDGEISDQELAGMFNRLNTRLSLVVIDACFSGGFARDVVNRPGVMGVFSSEEDLTSSVAGKFQAGGYLSHFLREGIGGAADENGDRLVTAGELSTYLREQFRTEVHGVQATTSDGQRNYQNLVIDRGGVQVDDVIVRLSE